MWQCGQCEVIVSRQTFNGFILLKISNIHLSLRVGQSDSNGTGFWVYLQGFYHVIFWNIHSTHSIFLILFWILCARVPRQMAHYLAPLFSGLWLVNYSEYGPLIGQLLTMLASDWSDSTGHRLSWGCWLEQTPDKLNVSIKPRFASVFLPKMINCLETLAVKHNPASSLLKPYSC